jgi:hypothetical protein
MRIFIILLNRSTTCQNSKVKRREKPENDYHSCTKTELINIHYTLKNIYIKPIQALLYHKHLIVLTSLWCLISLVNYIIYLLFLNHFLIKLSNIITSQTCASFHFFFRMSPLFLFCKQESIRIYENQNFSNRF